MNDPYRAPTPPRCASAHHDSTPCPSCGTFRCRDCTSRGVCETCVMRALDAIHAGPAAASAPAPGEPRARQQRTLVAVALGSALLGIVSATSAALASVHYIQNVQLRSLATSRGPRRGPRPHLVATATSPNPQPATAPCAGALPPVVTGST
ncbi:MAG: hypothetical protein WCJ30_02905, partial [Deltaproteobacteria bacterium]